jgi:hypothetical protein
MIPKCLLSADFIQPIEDGNIPMLLYRVNLIGAKEPYNTFVIKPPIRAVEPPSASPIAAGLLGTKLGKYTSIIHVAKADIQTLSCVCNNNIIHVRTCICLLN